MIRKKLLVCVVLILTAGVLLAGCTSSAAKTAIKETRLAVSNGEYGEAITYAKLAVKEGAKDESFIELVNLLEKYSEAEEALNNNDPDKALELVDSMDNPEANGMGGAVKTAKDKAQALLDAAETYEEDISKIEQNINNALFYSAASEAEKLLKNSDLTVSQRKKAEELLSRANEAKLSHTEVPKTAEPKQQNESVSSVPLSPKAMASEAEAVEIARKFLNISADAKYTYTIQLVVDYYCINFEVDYGEEIDEVGCKVDARGFYAYDPVG